MNVYTLSVATNPGSGMVYYAAEDDWEGDARRRFPLRVGLAFLGGLALAGVVAGVVLVSGGGSNRVRERSIDSVSPRAPDELPAEELAEQGEQTQERLEALDAGADARARWA